MMDGIKVVRVKTFINPNEGVILRMLDFLSFMVTGFFASLVQLRRGGSAGNVRLRKCFRFSKFLLPGKGTRRGSATMRRNLRTDPASDCCVCRGAGRGRN